MQESRISDANIEYGGTRWTCKVSTLISKSVAESKMSIVKRGDQKNVV